MIGLGMEMEEWSFGVWKQISVEDIENGKTFSWKTTSRDLKTDLVFKSKRVYPLVPDG